MTNLAELNEKLQSDDSEVRAEALDEIGATKLKGCTNIILPFLKDSVPEVRETAAIILGEVIDDKALPYLIDFCRHEQDRDALRAGFFALDNYRDKAIRDFLIDQTRYPKRSRVHFQQLAKQLRHYDTELSVRTLIKLFEDEDAFVQDYAAESLLQLNRVGLSSFWRNALKHHNDYVRKVALVALEQLQIV